MLFPIQRPDKNFEPFFHKEKYMQFNVNDDWTISRKLDGVCKRDSCNLTFRSPISLGQNDFVIPYAQSCFLQTLWEKVSIWLDLR